MRQKIEKQNKRILEFEKMKQGLYLKHHSKEELEALWELVQKWILNQDTLNRNMNLETGDKNILEERLKNISESYELIDDKEKYLPEEFIISKQDILRALYDTSMRKDIRKKIWWWLSYMATTLNPSGVLWVFSFFWWGFFWLNKNIIILQEFYIDLSQSFDLLQD